MSTCIRRQIRQCGLLPHQIPPKPGFLEEIQVKEYCEDTCSIIQVIL